MCVLCVNCNDGDNSCTYTNLLQFMNKVCCLQSLGSLKHRLTGLVFLCIRQYYFIHKPMLIMQTHTHPPLSVSHYYSFLCFLTSHFMQIGWYMILCLIHIGKLLVQMISSLFGGKEWILLKNNEITLDDWMNVLLVYNQILHKNWFSHIT